METSDRSEDYVKYEALRNAVWADPGDHLACPRTMAAENIHAHGGSLFIGVYRAGERELIPRDEAHLVGFAYGFAGVADPEIAYRDPANVIFYSQYAAVTPDCRKYSLGTRLKRFQARAVSEGMGLSVICCTFDPLAGVNAFRNLHRLGMEVPVYKNALYPGYAGHLNRLDVPSDRFAAVWDLRRPRNLPDIPMEDLLAADRLAVTSRLIGVEGADGPRRLPVVEEREIPAGDNPILVEIPYDFYTMLRDTDVEDPAVRRIPLDWRMATRHVFHTMFDLGWRVVDFLCLRTGGRIRDFYVLTR